MVAEAMAQSILSLRAQSRSGKIVSEWAKFVEFSTALELTNFSSLLRSSALEPVLRLEGGHNSTSVQYRPTLVQSV